MADKKTEQPKETPEQLIARLSAENERLRQQIAADGIPEELADLVQDKIDAGLTKEQAIAVAKTQLTHDTATKAAK